MNAERGNVGCGPAFHEHETDPAPARRVHGFAQPTQGRDLRPELLAPLAAQCGLGRFAGLPFPARELPAPGQGIRAGPPRNQDAAAPPDHPSHDDKVPHTPPFR